MKFAIIPRLLRTIYAIEICLIADNKWKNQRIVTMALVNNLEDTSHPLVWIGFVFLVLIGKVDTCPTGKFHNII